MICLYMGLLWMYLTAWQRAEHGGHVRCVAAAQAADTKVVLNHVPNAAGGLCGCSMNKSLGCSCLTSSGVPSGRSPAPEGGLGLGMSLSMRLSVRTLEDMHAARYRKACQAIAMQHDESLLNNGVSSDQTSS